MGELEGGPRLGRAVEGDPDGAQLAVALAMAARRDEDGARGAVEGSSGHVAGQHAADAPAVRRADHDEVGVAVSRGTVQGAARRAVGDHERARRHASALDLLPGDLDRTVVDDPLVLAVGPAAEVNVGGVGVDGDEVAAKDTLQRGRERERIATALAAVDADNDGLEHGVLLFVWCATAHAEPSQSPVTRA